MTTAPAPAPAPVPEPAPVPDPAPARRRWGAHLLPGLQKIGRSLQLPVAALPAAGLLSRLGADDVLGPDGLGWDRPARLLSLAGGALFSHLALLFCVGVAIGFARRSDGTTAFAALVGFLVYDSVLTAFPSEVTGKPEDPGVLGGIVLGLTAALLWQRYHRTRLPSWLGFFSGRRLVPVLMSFAGLLFGVAFGYAWGPVGSALNAFAEWLAGHGAWGSGLFGTANRLLIPAGMHMLLNSFAWFQFGAHTAPDGTVVHGDIARYFAGDPDAGMFMTGFFPVMMFALPAAALAITHCARPERRREVGGLMFSVALTAVLTGVTEPIEFSFMFIAPVLYGLHALLTGVSMAVTWALGMHAGFTFSGGLFDFALGWGHASRPWLVLPVGLVLAAVYYGVFRWTITRFDLPTPGRERDEGDGTAGGDGGTDGGGEPAGEVKVPAQGGGGERAGAPERAAPGV